jgi:hypothetical protein
VAYSIETGDAVSADPDYSGMVVADVSVTNLDNEVPDTIPLYVYDIRFVQHDRKADWWQAVFEIRADVDGDGVDADDTPGAGVAITVDFAGETFSGTTDSNGVFTTSWVRKLSSGTNYCANAVDLVLAGYSWNPLAMDLEDDTDGDGKPDELLLF